MHTHTRTYIHTHKHTHTHTHTHTHRPVKIPSFVDAGCLCVGSSNASRWVGLEGVYVVVVFVQVILTVTVVVYVTIVVM
jgi:hypothetical protein